jgi:hypothetical protein
VTTGAVRAPRATPLHPDKICRFSRIVAAAFAICAGFVSNPSARSDLTSRTYLLTGGNHCPNFDAHVTPCSARVSFVRPRGRSLSLGPQHGLAQSWWRKLLGQFNNVRTVLFLYHRTEDCPCSLSALLVPSLVWQHVYFLLFFDTGLLACFPCVRHSRCRCL